MKNIVLISFLMITTFFLEASLDNDGIIKIYYSNGVEVPANSLDYKKASGIYEKSIESVVVPQDASKLELVLFSQQDAHPRLVLFCTSSRGVWHDQMIELQ